MSGDGSDKHGKGDESSKMQEALVAAVRAIPDGQVSATARRAGIDLTQLLRLKRGEATDVRLSTLERLARGLEVHPAALLGGQPPSAKPIAAGAAPPPEKAASDWHPLPKVAFAAAGSPIQDLPADTVWYAFHRSWVERKAGKAAVKDEQRLLVVQVEKKHLGESMLPTVKPGAIVVVDRGPGGRGVADLAEVRQGGIYLCSPEGEGLTVKRVYHANGILSLVSDNPSHPPMPLLLRGRQLQRILIGRVIWIGQEEA